MYVASEELLGGACRFVAATDGGVFFICLSHLPEVDKMVGDSDFPIFPRG